MRRTISITNDELNRLLDNSTNASQLIEEALLYFAWAIKNRQLSDSELHRLFVSGLIKTNLN